MFWSEFLPAILSDFFFSRLIIEKSSVLRGCSGTWDLLRLTGSTICVGSELKILGKFSSHALFFTISALFGWVLNFEAEFCNLMTVLRIYGTLFGIELNVGKRRNLFLEKVIG